MRNLKVSFLALAIGALVAGCSSSASPNLQAFDGVKPTCSNYVGGNEIDNVKVTENKNAAPTVDFVTTDAKAGVTSALAKITHAETKVVRAGNGPKLTGDQLMIVEYAVYDSTTGTLMASSKFDGTDLTAQVFDSTNTKLYCDALGGVTEGSLVAFATPAIQADLHGSLYILDIKRIYLPSANGTVMSQPAGLPQVVRDPKTNRPALIPPSFSKPTSFKSAVIIEGKGEAIKKGDSVTVHYSLWQWTDRIGATIESSWDSQPATLTIQTPGVIPAFVKALVGVKVGSQVELVAPPEDAYGADGNGTIGPNATLVFVVDVLGINK